MGAELGSVADPGLDSVAFRDVIGRFATGVTVITTAQGEELFGATASAVTSLSDSPPMLLVCLNRQARTSAAVEATGRFVVNILAENSAEIAMRFAGRTEGKFALTPHDVVDGLPLLSGSIAHLVCETFEVTTGGTHLVFLARVVHANASLGHPLAYFRGKFGRMLTQPDADVIRIVRDWVFSWGREIEHQIDVSALSAEMGLEPGSVHHALTVLSAEGVVIRRDGRFWVAALSDAVISDAYAAKRVIEAGVATQVLGSLSGDELDELRRLAGNASAIVARRDPSEIDAWIDAWNQFNSYLVARAGSQALALAYSAVNLPGVDRRSIDERVYAHLDPDGAVEIVEAFASGDIQRAIAALSSPNRAPETIRRRAGLTS